MTNVLLFPGQGSQYIGMGKLFYENFDCVKHVFEEASDSLGIDMKDLVFDSNEDDLALTFNAQPAIMMISIAMLKVLIAETEIDLNNCVMAGHSLGEYTALTVSSVWSPFDAYKIVRKRGLAMQESAKSVESGMVAILGMKVDELELVPGCFIANDNCDGQLVISGTKDALDETVKLAVKAKRCVPLSVSAAFHSPFMEKAVDVMSEVFSQFKKNPLKNIVTSNVTTEEFEDELVIPLLLKQLTSRVRWREQIIKLSESYPGCKFIEVGPKQVLTNLVKRIVKDHDIIHIEDIIKLS